MTQDLVSPLAAELSRNYNQMKDRAIWFGLLRVEGSIPHPDDLRRYGMFVRSVQGADDCEEFRWRGKPLFQIRIKFDELKAVIQIKELP